MSRTFFAALLALCGLSATAPAQMFYGGPTGYTSYYGPTYFHAPAASPGYATTSYTTGYRGGYGPLGVLNPITWFGWRPYRSAAYTSPFYGSTTTAAYTPSYGYTASYAPSYGYTAAYSPLLTGTTTSYYAPVESGIALASYDVPAVTGTACCQPSCCVPCAGGCSSCASGNCPGGNCALNYAPSTDLSPKPDPAASGSSGSRTFESESGGANDSGSGGTNNDAFRRRTPNRPNDGYDSDASRSSGYRPQTKIEQKAPMNSPEEPEAEVDGEAGTNSGSGAAGEQGDGPMVAPAEAEEPNASAEGLNLDSKVAAGPSLLPERRRMKARFGSPQLARAKADPEQLPASSGVRLVRK